MGQIENQRVGNVVVDRYGCVKATSYHGCTISSVSITNSQLDGDVRFIGCTINGPVTVKANRTHFEETKIVDAGASLAGCTMYSSDGKVIEPADAYRGLTHLLDPRGKGKFAVVFENCTLGAQWKPASEPEPAAEEAVADASAFTVPVTEPVTAKTEEVAS